MSRETGDKYVGYRQTLTRGYEKVTSGVGPSSTSYRRILIEDEDVADAVIADPGTVLSVHDASVDELVTIVTGNEFFRRYEPGYSYRVIKPSKEVQEIYDYMCSISKEDTSSREFNSHMEKYSLEHILEAHSMLPKIKETL